MLGKLFSAVLETSLAASAVLCAVLLLGRLLTKRYSAGLKYWVWLVVFLRLMVPWSFSLPGTPISLPAPVSAGVPAAAAFVPAGAGGGTGGAAGEAQVPAVSPTAETEAAEQVPASGSVQSSSAAPSLSLAGLLPLVWLAGAAAVLLFRFSGYFLFLLQVRRRKTEVPPRVSELLARLSSEMKLRAYPRIFFCGGTKSPLMAGLFRHTILLPRREYPEASLEMILRHELVHLKRHDLWYKLLLVLAGAVHWFNPLVHLAAKRAAYDLELSCDETVLKNTPMEYRVGYGETMLDVMRLGFTRQTSLSTQFSADRKSILGRFSNILDTGTKRRGVSVFCALVLAVAAFSVLVGWGSAGVDGEAGSGFEPGSVYSYSSAWDPILSYDAGNSYSIGDDGTVTLSYHSGAATAVAPLTVIKDSQDQVVEQYPGVFLSADKTAIAYGDFDGTTPLEIYISDDMGRTWQTSELSLPGIGVTRTFIGFRSETDGWLVVCNWHAMTYESNYLYTTSDGGKTWTQVSGNQEYVYPSVVTGAGVSDGNTAFLCFWYYEKGFEPPIIRSLDGGVTWEKLYLNLPEEYDGYHKTALSPVFSGAAGTLPVLLSGEGASDYTGIVYFTSTDYGKTWSFDNRYNLAQVWAYAWQSRNGKPRFDIMSASMQAEFRAQQQKNDQPEDNYVIRWSSPWVERYDVAMDGGDAVITYWYADSAGYRETSSERLTFGTENGRTVVTGCGTNAVLQEYTREIPLCYTQAGSLAPEKLPVTDGSDVSEVLKMSKLGGMTQVIYNSRTGEKFQSYLEVGGVKYAMGYVGYGLNTLQKTDLGAGSPVYSLTEAYGASYDVTCYYMIKDNIPYRLSQLTGDAAEKDLDGDGRPETISQYYSGAPEHEYVIYQWDFTAGTVRYEKLTDLFGCDTVDYDADTDLYFARRSRTVQGSGGGTDLQTDAGLSYRLDGGVFSLVTDATPEGIKNSFYLSVRYDPGEGVLRFTVPEQLPDGSRFYLHVSGRMFMDGTSSGMSFHAFEQESEQFSWVPGKTYTYPLDSGNLDQCLLEFGLLNGQNQGDLFTISVSPDGSKWMA